MALQSRRPPPLDRPGKMQGARRRKRGTSSVLRQLFPSSHRMGWPGATETEVGPIANFESGTESRRAQAGAPAAASPRAPSGCTHRVLLRASVKGVRPRWSPSPGAPGPGRRLPQRAGPPPGSPAPGPALSSPPRPQPHSPTAGAGAAGIVATGGCRGAGGGSRLASEKRRGRLSWVAPSRCRESDFSFAPPLLLQSLRNLWKRERIGPLGQPLEGGLGGTLPYFFFCRSQISQTLAPAWLTTIPL